MFERVALYAIAALAVTALAYGGFVNVSTFSADPPVARFPGMAVLHFGIFPVVGAAAILFARRMRLARDAEEEASVFRFIPLTLRLLTLALGLYAIGLSIEQTTIGDVGVPSIMEGEYVLHNHGRIVRVLTADEYRIEQAGDARVATAFHLAFYMTAFAMAVGCLRMPGATVRQEAPPVEPSAAPRAAWKV